MRVTKHSPSGCCLSGHDHPISFCPKRVRKGYFSHSWVTVAFLSRLQTIILKMVMNSGSFNCYVLSDPFLLTVSVYIYRTTYPGGLFSFCSMRSILKFTYKSKENITTFAWVILSFSTDYKWALRITKMLGCSTKKQLQGISSKSPFPWTC